MPFNYHTNCCVSTCCNQTPGWKYHTFPTDELLCSLWLERIGDGKLFDLDRGDLRANYLLCSRHFHMSCIMRKNLNGLRCYSLPILNLPNCKLEIQPENYAISKGVYLSLRGKTNAQRLIEAEHNYSTENTPTPSVEIDENTSVYFEVVKVPHATKYIEITTSLDTDTNNHYLSPIIDLIPPTPLRENRFKLVESDFNKICVICFGLKAHVTDLYDINRNYFKKNTLHCIFKNIYNDVRIDERMPQNLCMPCIKIVLQTHQFLEQIKTAQKMYENILSIRKVVKECSYRDDLGDVEKLMSFCTFETNNCNVNAISERAKQSPVVITQDLIEFDDAEFFIHTENNAQLISSSKENINLQIDVNSNGIIEIAKELSLNCSSIVTTDDNDHNLNSIQDSDVTFTSSNNSIKNNNTVDIATVNNSNLDSNIKSGDKEHLKRPETDYNNTESEENILNCHVTRNSSNRAEVAVELTENNNSCDMDEAVTLNKESQIETADGNNVKEYIIILKRSLDNGVNPVEDCDDDCDVDFDEDIDAMTDFKLGKFLRSRPHHYEKYRCSVCSAWFRSLIEIKKHRDELDHRKKRSDTGAYRKNKCNICGFKVTKKSMKLHLKTHLPPKRTTARIMCPNCGELFTKELMQNHLPCSQQKIDHNCPVCSFTTKSFVSLTRHNLLHETDMHFSCQLCNYIAIEKNNLERHIIKSHPDLQAVYKCNICGKEYKRKFDFLRHKNRTHKPKIKNKTITRTQFMENSTKNNMDVNIKEYLCQIRHKRFVKRHAFQRHVDIAHELPVDKTTTFPMPVKKSLPVQMLNYLSKLELVPKTENNYRRHSSRIAQLKSMKKSNDYCTDKVAFIKIPQLLPRDLLFAFKKQCFVRLY